MTMVALTTERRCQWSFFLQLCVQVPLRAVVFLWCVQIPAQNRVPAGSSVKRSGYIIISVIIIIILIVCSFWVTKVKLKARDEKWFRLIILSLAVPYLLSLEGEVKEFMLHCISCAGCSASHDRRWETRRMALKELGIKWSWSTSSFCPLSRGRASCL
jgi:hypothetical protein